MTTLHQYPTRSTHPLPTDPTARYHTLAPLTGQWIILVTGRHAIEGQLSHVHRPNPMDDQPAPNVTCSDT